MAPSPIAKAKQVAENFVYKTLSKFGYPSAQTGIGPRQEQEPPYERRVPPQWLYNMRRKHALINNSIEEKVNQTFRRAFTEWQPEYAAKCESCGEEFDTLEPFREQLGDDGQNIAEDKFDFEKPRLCPNCGELSEMLVPDPDEQKRGEGFMGQVNERGKRDQFLEGNKQNSVGQTFLDVCKEVAWDIESFDDGWMVFERDYILNADGEIIDWELTGVHRSPPELMRYSVSDEGKKGEMYWICPRCRATDENYEPQNHGTDCKHCEAKTYRAYAELLQEPGGEPLEWYIRGEFAHGSLYEPSKFYGFSPIITLWEEARTLEQMDKWYKESYEERRAPRGAMVIRSTNAESVRSWNQQQMEALRHDPQHIPTFIDDTDGKASPLTWQPLLDDPAQMQHMQMREWFLERISAKYGVTAIFQNASPANSGLSQSMEIIVSNRAAMRLKAVFDDIFIPAFISQLQIEGWFIEVNDPEEEDEVAEAERIGKELQNAQLAQGVGAEVEWTQENSADIKPGMLEPPEDDMGGGLGGMLGGMGGGMGGEDPAGGEDPFAGLAAGPDGGRPPEAETVGGAPAMPDEPGQGNEIAYADNSVSSGDSGFSNASYGGRRGGVINIFDHINEMLGTEQDSKMQKRLLGQAKVAYDTNYKHLGLNADIVEEYAQDTEKSFYSLCEDHYGTWMKEKDVRDSTSYLYELLGGDKQ